MDILEMVVIVKADGNPFDNTGQVLALPTQDRSFANIYLVQSGASIVRYFFKNGLADGDLSVWNTAATTPLYDAYVALLSQSGSDDPAANVLNGSDSNYLGAITWSRVGAGLYWGTKTGAFTDATKLFFLTGAADISGGSVIITRVDANKIQIETKGSNGSDADAILSSYPIEIRVYS